MLSNDIDRRPANFFIWLLALRVVWWRVTRLPGRGAIPLLDELKLASEEENWEVGIAICKLKDR